MTLKSLGHSHTLLIERLSSFNIRIAKIFSFFGFKVFYLSPGRLIEKEGLLSDLRRKNILPISQDFFGTVLVSGYMKRNQQLSEQFVYDLIKKNPLVEKFEHFFSLRPSQRNKLHTALLHQVCSYNNEYLYNCGKLIEVAKLICSEKKYKIFFIAKRNFLTNKAFKYSRTGINLNLPGSSIFPLFSKLLSKYTKKSISSTSPDLPYRREKIKEAKKYSTQQVEVIYFPHQGIFYGGDKNTIFIKDQYYSSDSSSKLFPSRILHLSENESEDCLKSSYNYYKENNIPHDRMSNVTPRIKKQLVVKEFLKMLNPFSKTTYNLSALNFWLTQFYSLYKAKSFVEHFPNLKMILIGYDFLFSRYLPVICSSKSIYTLANQERFLLPHFPGTHLNLSHYFTLGNDSKTYFHNNPNRFDFDHVESIGYIRTDLIVKELETEPDQKYRDIKKEYKLVLASDYNPTLTRERDFFSEEASWTNIQKFYNDLILLAKKFTDLYIVIKPKEYVLDKIPEFSEIVEKISRIPNLEIETNLELYTPAKMIAWADLAIGLYSSILEEMISVGKDAIIYDFINMPTPYFDFRPYGFVSENYSQLEQMTQKFLNNGYLLSIEQRNEISNHLFTNLPSKKEYIRTVAENLLKPDMNDRG